MKPVCIYQDLEVNFISENDLGDIVQMIQKPAVYEHLSFGEVGLNEVYSFFQPIIQETKTALHSGDLPGNHVFILRKEGKFIGNGGLLQHPCADGNYILAYTIDQEAWKKGFGSLVCRYLIDYAFSLPNVFRLTAECMANNIGSVKILQKNGFQLEGIQKDFWSRDGRFTDNLLFGLVKNDSYLLN